MASVASSHQGVGLKNWWVPLGLTTMSLSLVVNAVVSALMISRIYLVYRETKLASDNTSTKLSWVASILLESAVALFFAQLVYLVLYKMEHSAFSLVAGPVTIIYVGLPFSSWFYPHGTIHVSQGLNCTAIMVRVSMDRSYETVSTTRQQSTSLVFTINKNEKSSHVSDFSNSAQLGPGLENQRNRRFVQSKGTETTIV
uniref:Uncharacterized protein n=1 Tax=Candolleomyces aberdarensis TaxID=2316362 RepID=A0A4Q2CZU1_9AGAR